MSRRITEICCSCQLASDKQRRSAPPKIGHHHSGWTKLGFELTSTDATVVLVLPMEHPRLWWTRELGDPYTCHLSLAAGSEWPPDWNKLAYHDFQYDLTSHVAQVPMGRDWEQFVASSQRDQAEVMKIGSLFRFQFVEGWPSVTWSVVSYGRKPKLGYYALKRAYRPALILRQGSRSLSENSYPVVVEE